MESVWTGAMDRVSGALVQLENSSAGEQYRLLVSAVRLALERLQRHLAELSVVQLVGDSIRNKSNEFMFKVAWAGPFFRSVHQGDFEFLYTGRKKI